VALVAVAVATAGPGSGWIFGPGQPGQMQADLTFQTDNGQPAFYQIFTSPQPITGLTCPGGAHAIFPFNGNLDAGECGPFSGPGLSTGLVIISGANPFACGASFADQASFDMSTYTPQNPILSLNSCPSTPPAFSGQAMFNPALQPQVTKQWNSFVQSQLTTS